jgi:hypothetical protein
LPGDIIHVHRSNAQPPLCSRRTRYQVDDTAVHVETPVSVTIIELGYRVRCTEPGCRNVGRVIMRQADAGGRPIDNAEFCLAHGRSRIERDRAAGVRVYDNRES